MQSLTDTFGPVISSYTREDALDDGTLVDVTEQASTREMMGGFEHQVVISRAVHVACENIPASLEGCNDYRGRLHDVLWMARLAAGNALKAAQEKGEGSGCRFCVILPRKGTRKRNAHLRLVPTMETGTLSFVIGFPEDF